MLGAPDRSLVVLQVDGADLDECDRANDRANVSLTVCEG